MNQVSLGNKISKLIKYLHRNNDEYAQYSIGDKKIIVLFSPKPIYELFTSKNKNFVRGISFDNMRLVFGNGILVSDDPEHIKNKKIMSPAFHKNEIDKSCEEVYKIANSFLKDYEDKEIDILEISQNYTFSCVSKCFFGEQFPSEFLQIIYDVHHKVANTEIINLNKEDFVNFDEIKNFCIKVIKNNKGKNLVKLMIDSGMKEEDIVDQMTTLLLAGFETTSNLISWSIFYLAENPKILQNLRNEKNAWIQENRPPSLKEIMGSTMTQKIIKETLRTRPPIYWTSRTSKSKTTLDNINIEKDTHIFISQQTSHLNTKYFENPKQWNPERWTEEFEKNLPKGAYFPFGYGGTKCIGDQFGILLASMFILLFSSKYQFKNIKDFPKEGHMVSLFPTENTKIEISSML